MPISKKVPMRSCVSCRRKIDKHQLTRFVNTEEGVFFDPSGKRAGRGAYVCQQMACRERIVNTDVLAKALRVALVRADRQRIHDAVL